MSSITQIAFNENLRVKIPAILDFMQLGYTYIPQCHQFRRVYTNVLEVIFLDRVFEINNKELSMENILCALDELSLELDYYDMG